MGVENESDRNSIIQKIKTAEAYYLKEKEIFFSDRRLMGLLQDLEIAIRDSRQTMEEIGITPICRDCEEKEGGSCCGKGLENKYSETLLLINLLLDISLPKTRYDQKSCFFLGNKGCLLAARHVICVNYLCAKIKNLCLQRCNCQLWILCGSFTNRWRIRILPYNYCQLLGKLRQ